MTTQLDGTLNDLARLRSGSDPIVTLYLDTRWNDEHQRNRVRLFLQEQIRQSLAHYPPGTPGRDGLERTFGRITEWVTGLLGQAYEQEKNGVVVFACEALGLWRTFTFHRPFENELAVDGIPHLVQLARLRDDFAPAIVVVPSQDGADIYQVTLGELAIEANLRGFVPRTDEDTYKPSPNAPGHRYEREQKNERHQDAFIQKARRASAAQVTVLFDQNPGSKLVLVGTSEQLAAFDRELPERVRSCVIARTPKPREWESADGVRRDGIVAGASKAIAEREVQDEEQVIDAVVGQALRGGLGVIGPNDVVEAVNQGRVHRLVLEADFRMNGWSCDNCNALGANTESQESCPYCGAHVRAVQHLGEALVVRALQEGADVEVVAHANKLHSYRGVAAFLRQTAQNGLRGASQPWPTAPGANHQP